MQDDPNPADLRAMLAFARLHDWGARAWIEWEDGALMVPCSWVDADTGEQGEDIECARSMHELREIAGY
jgi:hypothetical protein